MMRTNRIGWGIAAVAGLLAVGCERSDPKRPDDGEAKPRSVASADEASKREDEATSGMNPGASGSAARAGVAADGTGAVDGQKGSESAPVPVPESAPEADSAYDSVLPQNSVATRSGQDRAAREARPESESTTGGRFEITSLNGEEVVLRPLDETSDSRDNVAGYEVTLPRAEFDGLVGTLATPARSGLRLTLTRDGTGKTKSITFE